MDSWNVERVVEFLLDNDFGVLLELAFDEHWDGFRLSAFAKDPRTLK